MLAPSAGWTPMIWIHGAVCSLRYRAVPMMVPVVPMALTKWVTVPLGVAPDLGTRGFVVCPRIVRIGELVEHLALAASFHLVGQVAGPFHALLAVYDNDLGTVGAHRGPPFETHVLGHDERHAIAADGRGHGERNARIAAGGLDETIAGPDLAALLGAADHGQRRSVLDRARPGCCPPA